MWKLSRNLITGILHLMDGFVQLIVMWLSLNTSSLLWINKIIKVAHIIGENPLAVWLKLIPDFKNIKPAKRKHDQEIREICRLQCHCRGRSLLTYLLLSYITRWWLRTYLVLVRWWWRTLKKSGSFINILLIPYLSVNQLTSFSSSTSRLLDPLRKGWLCRRMSLIAHTYVYYN